MIKAKKIAPAIGDSAIPMLVTHWQFTAELLDELDEATCKGPCTSGQVAVDLMTYLHPLPLCKKCWGFVRPAWYNDWVKDGGILVHPAKGPVYPELFTPIARVNWLRSQGKLPEWCIANELVVMEDMWIETKEGKWKWELTIG